MAKMKKVSSLFMLFSLNFLATYAIYTEPIDYAGGHITSNTENGTMVELENLMVFQRYMYKAATKDGEPEQVVLIDVYKDKEKTPPESLKLWKNEDYILSILNEDDPMPENSGYLKNYHLIEDGTLSPKIKKKLLRQFSDNFAKKHSEKAALKYARVAARVQLDYRGCIYGLTLPVGFDSKFFNEGVIIRRIGLSIIALKNFHRKGIVHGNLNDYTIGMSKKDTIVLTTLFYACKYNPETKTANNSHLYIKETGLKYRNGSEIIIGLPTNMIGTQPSECLLGCVRSFKTDWKSLVLSWYSVYGTVPWQRSQYKLKKLDKYKKGEELEDDLNLHLARRDKFLKNISKMAPYYEDYSNHFNERVFKLLETIYNLADEHEDPSESMLSECNDALFYYYDHVVKETRREIEEYRKNLDKLYTLEWDFFPQFT